MDSADKLEQRRLGWNHPCSWLCESSMCPLNDPPPLFILRSFLDLHACLSDMYWHSDSGWRESLGSSLP